MQSIAPIPYTSLIQHAEVMANDSLQKELFNHELYCMAKNVKQRFPEDTRSVEAIAKLIVRELLDGRWDYRVYLSRKRQGHTPHD